MCSIVEDDFGDDGGAHAMVEDVKLVYSKICKKCKEQSSVAKSMCHQCFVAHIRHKFRATLGSTKIVHRHSNVLLDFTGNAANVCLTEMIRFAFEQESYKRLSFDLEVVFIDENCVTKHGKESQRRFEKIQEVQAVLTQFPNFKCYYTSIAATDDSLKLISELEIDDFAAVIDTEAKFLSKFTKLLSLTSKQDLLAVTRNDILRHVATSLNCPYIFNSDISVTLANKLLTNMSLGRGSSTAYDVAFCDDRIESLKFIRPLKDVSEEEVKFYIELENLNCLNDVNYGSDHGQFASIQNLTSRFIDDLQQNFSSTVSTVYRTCGKIAALDDAEEVDGVVDDIYQRNLKIHDQKKRCFMCKSFLDYQNSETLFAINFSRTVSEAAGAVDRLKALASIEDKLSANNDEAKKHLCHGCRNIFIGMDDELKEIL